MAKLTITEKEYEELRRMGKTKEQIIQEYSADKPSLASRAVKGIASTFAKGATDTIATNLANIGVATKGLANVPGALLGNQASKARFNAAVQTSQNLQQTNLKQNIGAGAQLGSLAAGGISGAGAAFLPRVGASALQGAAAFGGQAAAENSGAQDVAQAAALGGVLGAGITTAAAGVEKLGKGIYKYFIPTNKQEAALLQTYKANASFADRIKAAATGNSSAPRTTADTAFQKGFVGTEPMIGVQAKRAQTTLWEKLIKPQLDSVKQPVEMSTVFNEVRNKLNAIPENTRRKALIDALQSITDDYIDTPTVSLTKLQDIKSALAAPVPEKAYLGSYIQGSVNVVRKEISDIARKKIYESLGPAIRTAYIDYNNLSNLKKLGQVAMTGQRLKGGSGTLLNGIIEQVMVPITTLGGLTIYKVGNAVELIGKPGLQTVGQFILNLTNESGQQQDTEAKSPLQYQRKSTSI